MKIMKNITRLLSATVLALTLTITNIQTPAYDIMPLADSIPSTVIEVL